MNAEPEVIDQVMAWDRPAANPIPFPTVRNYGIGKRSTVLVDVEDEEILAENVLYEDFSRRFSEYEDDEQELRAMKKLKEAYWPIPNKKKIKAIVGHIEFCYVLEPRIMKNGDIVFRMTNKIAIVKVSKENYAWDLHREFCGIHFIGDEYPHVMGAKVGLMTAVENETVFNVVMRWGGHELFHELYPARPTDTNIQIRTNFSEDRARRHFRQIVNGLQFLHRKGISHRDISLENVVVNRENHATIIDMGHAIRVPYTDPQAEIDGTTDILTATNILLGNQNRLEKQLERRRVDRQHGMFGKEPYLCPEAYPRGKSHFDGPSADVWATGITLFRMLTAQQSYDVPTKHDYMYVLMTTNMTGLLTCCGIELSDDCVNLLTRMLQPDPSMRITIDQILDHEWLRVPDAVGNNNGA